MNKKDLDALLKVIEYLWDIEKKDYEETYEIQLDESNSNLNEMNCHIFVHLVRLSEFAQAADFVYSNH